MQRLLSVYPYAIWLNPQPRNYWPHYSSIKMIRELMGERMFPLTLEGLDEGIKALRRQGA